MTGSIEPIRTKRATAEIAECAEEEKIGRFEFDLQILLFVILFSAFSAPSAVNFSLLCVLRVLCGESFG
jgi:hypothetical protein